MNSGLFKGIEQKPISIRGHPANSPMFVPDLSIMGALFLSDFDWVSSLLPDPAYRAIQVLPGKALVSLHALSYRVCDVGPYNEFSFAVPCSFRNSKLPFVPSIGWGLSGLMRKFSGYVVDLPVSTEISVAGGVDFFNFPKYLADITFRQTATHHICTVRDQEHKDLIVELEGRRIPDKRLWGGRLPAHFRTIGVNLFPVIDGRSKLARMKIDLGHFGASVGFGAKVRIGDSAHAAIYTGASFGPVVHYIYAPKCQGILFEPEDI